MHNHAPVNCNIEALCRELDLLDISYDTEWFPADNLLGLFFTRFDGRTEGCAFRINGYFSPLLIAHSGTLDADEGYISVGSMTALIKNAYCKQGAKWTKPHA